MTDTERYPARVFWSDEDEGFIAIAPDLPGCSAFGETQAAALAQLQDAIVAWREAMAKAGNRVPDPPPSATYSGKFLLRMPKDLHAQFATTADAQGVSLNTYLNVLLTGSHERLQAARQHEMKWAHLSTIGGFEDHRFAHAVSSIFGRANKVLSIASGDTSPRKAIRQKQRA